MSRIMSLDQATKKCGYAIFDSGKLIESGVFISNDKDSMKRIEEIYVKINNKAKEYDIDSFIFEDTFQKVNIQVTKLLCWLQGAIMSMAFIEDYGFVMYMPTSWRKELGFKKKSKSNKESLDFKTNREYQKFQAIRYVNSELGLMLSQDEDDRAEAICIGLAYLK